MKVRFVRVMGGGEGRWDSHADMTETAIVWTGDFNVELRDGTVTLGPGQCCVVPVGAEHRGTSKGGAEVILFTDAAGKHQGPTPGSPERPATSKASEHLG